MILEILMYYIWDYFFVCMCVHYVITYFFNTYVYIMYLLLTTDELLLIWLVLRNLFIVPADMALFIQIVPL